MKIDVGGAKNPKNGFLVVDKYGVVDFQADFISLPFDDNSIEEVYTSHTLEHLAKNEVPLALKEIYRVLIPNGKFTVIVPDLEWCLMQWLKTENKRGFFLDTVYGNQVDEGEFHKTGFSLESLKTLVFEAGLRIDKSEYLDDHSVRSIIIEGGKDGKGSI